MDAPVRKGELRTPPFSGFRAASGDHSAVEPPVPIPNTEVKRCSANGSRTTGPARVGRCQNITAQPGENQAGLLAFTPETRHACPPHKRIEMIGWEANSENRPHMSLG